MPLPLWLQRVIGQNTVFIRYGPIAILAGIFALLAGISVFLTQVYLNANFRSQVNVRNITLNIFHVSGSPGVSLNLTYFRLADMFSIDMNGQILSVHWSLVGACGWQFTGSSNDDCVQNQFVNNIALYLNENATVNWNATTPIGTFDASTVQNPPPVAYIPGREKLPAHEYNTDLSMDPFLPYTLQKQVSTLYYPFDEHSAYVSLLTIDTDSNTSLPISGVIGYGSMVNWIGTSAFYPTTVGDETLYPLALTVKRQKMVKAFALVLVVTNWALSVTILWMTILVLFRANVNDGLILASTTDAPLTSSFSPFALPQIRASMPDSPPFDIAGYFMNVCLVSICTSILLFSQLQYRYRPGATSEGLPPSQRAVFIVGAE
ncbi:uncharacterized protein EDB91DRAFT_1064312 [Suillus paluster]|uniref:uncharacterized protein n=1 Tax=Suillus paluster TaxID=48578 RepID=UPI001B877D53|nr:uncharacterized protein EDB91DRAFT_1064312 [Suillus paluster]KAG1721696.1 hypothetical protein EDB91DRAFT_1064312 [Suillus paluster]